jgi:type II secretory ATPase GspE/PulE/Tfp pilus assembly ATPase PilB-like protein
MRRPSGLILATGPTGSGKTTLLYSCLQEVDTAKYKVLTIEDPVEYRITDITQVEVNRRMGLTFSTALRCFQRQEPDIIVCGELPDPETAATAVAASLIGHLVLSTLHTEDALTAILRLADMGVERYVVAATLTGIVARRLARRLCPHCKAIASAEESALLVGRARRMTVQGGYDIPDGADFYTAVGCDQCHGTGYQGRLGLFEILACTPKLVGQLLQCDSREAMTRLAVDTGMRTLLADGMRKAVDGETSIDEVLRATGTWL